MGKRKYYPKPFVKWAGGKTRLLNVLISKLPKDFKDFKSYYEIFLSGGALFFELSRLGLLKDKKVILSDANHELITTYRQVRDNLDELLENLDEYKSQHNEDFYYRVRALDRKPSVIMHMTDVEIASRFIYLNKTCFNGLYRVNKKGQFNTPIGDCRNIKLYDKNAMLDANKALQGAELYTTNFCYIAPNKKSDRDFMYMDPPYPSKRGKKGFVDYTIGGFNSSDHEMLSVCVKGLTKNGFHIMQSNANIPYIQDLYKEYDIEDFKVSRAMENRVGINDSKNELIITNYNRVIDKT